jgi:hypothetical protein
MGPNAALNAAEVITLLHRCWPPCSWRFHAAALRDESCFTAPNDSLTMCAPVARPTADRWLIDL